MKTFIRLVAYPFIGAGIAIVFFAIVWVLGRTVDWIGHPPGIYFIGIVFLTGLGKAFMMG